MSIDRLIWQVDAVRAQAAALRERADRSDPEDRARLADIFEQLDAGLDELHASEIELRAWLTALLEAQATVETERERYRELFDLAPGALMLTDPAGRIHEVNHAAAELLGAPSWLLVGQPLAAFVAERPAPMTFFTALGQFKSTDEGIRECEMQFRSGRGRIFTAVLTIAPDRSLAGDVIGLRLLMRESSQQQHRAEANESLLPGVLDAVPDGILVSDADGRIMWVNAQIERMFGYTRDELIGQPVEILIPERFRTRHRRRRLDDAAPLHIRLTSKGLELSGRRKDGTELPAEINSTTLQVDGVTLIAFVIRDVTERSHQDEERRGLLARAEAAEAAEAYYRSLFEESPDAIVLFDMDAHLLDGNSAAAELLGYTRQEIRQLRLDDLAADDAPLLGEGALRLQHDGSWRGELELRRKDGRVVTVEADVATLSLPDRVVRRAALRDISDRRREQLEFERRQRDFVAMISHELMNPLNGILLHAEILQMTGSYRERSVDAIVTSAHQEQRLVEDLLDLSRADAGRLRLRPSRVDLAQLLRFCIAQQLALTSSHALRLDAPFEMPPGSWDRGRIEQICHNLLSNAVKYSPNGGEILVRVEDLGDHARVSVIDHGVGIAREVLPRLFDRYYRARDGADRIDGLGLGLHITRALVEAHGGTITADSELGRGSVFRVMLPYNPPRSSGGS